MEEITLGFALATGFTHAFEADHLVAVGALAAYTRQKFEQARAEMYIYDLAVHPEHRRKRVATGLMEARKPIARSAGASVIFVRAGRGVGRAITLFSELGNREDVLHLAFPVG